MPQKNASILDGVRSLIFTPFPRVSRVPTSESTHDCADGGDIHSSFMRAMLRAEDDRAPRRAARQFAIRLYLEILMKFLMYRHEASTSAIISFT